MSSQNPDGIIPAGLLNKVAGGAQKILLFSTNNSLAIQTIQDSAIVTMER